MSLLKGFFVLQAYTHSVDKVENLTEEITSSVAIMQVQGFHEVLNQSFDLCLSLLLGLNHGTSHALGYYPDLTLFPLFPHPVWHIEKYTLEEQHERYPLVVRVVPFLPIIATQTRMGHVGTHGLRVVLRQCERVRDPAKRVDHMAGGYFRQAVDRIACERKTNDYRPFYVHHDSMKSMISLYIHQSDARYNVSYVRNKMQSVLDLSES